jgi:hypothetical protein
MWEKHDDTHSTKVDYFFKSKKYLLEILLPKKGDQFIMQ